MYSLLQLWKCEWELELLLTFVSGNFIACDNLYHEIGSHCSEYFYSLKTTFACSLNLIQTFGEVGFISYLEACNIHIIYEYICYS